MKNAVTLLLLCIVATSCVNKDKLKQEIKDELRKEIYSGKFVEKGNGNNFYCEYASIGNHTYEIHHSTLNCPEIKSGVLRNWRYTKAEDSNLFCHVCMSDNLIDIFNSKYSEYQK